MHPQGGGKLNVHIAQLWAHVRLCARRKWVNRVGLAGYRRTLVNGHRQVGSAGPFRARPGRQRPTPDDASA